VGGGRGARGGRHGSDTALPDHEPTVPAGQGGGFALARSTMSAPDCSAPLIGQSTARRPRRTFGWPPSWCPRGVAAHQSPIRAGAVARRGRWAFPVVGITEVAAVAVLFALSPPLARQLHARPVWASLGAAYERGLLGSSRGRRQRHRLACCQAPRHLGCRGLGLFRSGHAGQPLPTGEPGLQPGRAVHTGHHQRAQPRPAVRPPCGGRDGNGCRTGQASASPGSPVPTSSQSKAAPTQVRY
jgi:hypothetical protein